MDDDRTVALVSGTTGVIGNVTANELAATPGCEVVLLARDECRAKMAADEIRTNTANDAVRFILADVSRRQSIQAAADNWEGPAARSRQ
jgi:short-subunit dehydrogenase